MSDSASEIDVWRAADMMLKLYPEGAAMAAAMRADAAQDQGDDFNFNLWRRVTKALNDLERKAPKEDESLN